MRDLREMLIKLDQIGVLGEVLLVIWGRDGKSLDFSTCGAFKLVCEASRAQFKISDFKGWGIKSLVQFDATIGDGITIRHTCRHDLPCWGEL